MAKKRAVERLEKAERIARKVWRDAGVDRPDEAQLSVGILIVLEEWKKHGEEASE